jgi:hypothetical protein
LAIPQVAIGLFALARKNAMRMEREAAKGGLPA